VDPRRQSLLLQNSLLTLTKKDCEADIPGSGKASYIIIIFIIIINALQYNIQTSIIGHTYVLNMLSVVVLKVCQQLVLAARSMVEKLTVIPEL